MGPDTEQPASGEEPPHPQGAAEPAADARGPAAEHPVEPAAPPPEVRRERVFVGSGIFWGFVLTLVLLAAVILFIAQNTQTVTIEWGAWSIDGPLIAFVLAAILVAVVVDELVGLIWRRRRRRVKSERNRLKGLTQRVKEFEDRDADPG